MSARDDRHDVILAILGGGQGGSPLDMMAHTLASMSDADRLALARALVPEMAVAEPDLAALRAERDALAAEIERIRSAAAHQADAHTLRTGQKMLADLVRSWGYENKPQESNGALIRRVLDEQRARVETLEAAADSLLNATAAIHPDVDLDYEQKTIIARAERNLRAALEPKP